MKKLFSMIVISVILFSCTSVPKEAQEFIYASSDEVNLVLKIGPWNSSYDTTDLTGLLIDSRYGDIMETHYNGNIYTPGYTWQSKYVWAVFREELTIQQANNLIEEEHSSRIASGVAAFLQGIGGIGDRMTNAANAPTWSSRNNRQ